MKNTTKAQTKINEDARKAAADSIMDMAALVEASNEEVGKFYDFVTELKTAKTLDEATNMYISHTVLSAQRLGAAFGRVFERNVESMKASMSMFNPLATK